MNTIKKILIFSAIIHLESSFAKCNTEAVVYKHQTSIGFSFGTNSNSSLNDAETVNIPLSINDQAACFRKKSKFNIKTEEKTDKSKGKIIITPLLADFENVPNPSVKQYIFATKNSDHLVETKFYSMSFVCMGEIPLSAEGTADNYLQLEQKTKNANVSVTHVFATGAAADNIKNNNYNPGMQNAFEFFTNLYSQIANKPVDTICCGMKVPSVFTATSISALSNIEREITRSFSTVSKNVPNGCSNEFAEKMHQYLIENIDKNESVSNFDISKKWFSNDLVLEWKNKN